MGLGLGLGLGMGRGLGLDEVASRPSSVQLSASAPRHGDLCQLPTATRARRPRRTYTVATTAAEPVAAVGRGSHQPCIRACSRPKASHSAHSRAFCADLEPPQPARTSIPKTMPRIALAAPG